MGVARVSRSGAHNAEARQRIIAAGLHFIHGRSRTRTYDLTDVNPEPHVLPRVTCCGNMLRFNVLHVHQPHPSFGLDQPILTGQ